MKFKLKLDEALFDDEVDNFITKDKTIVLDDFDDDYSEYESEHDVENVPSGPADGADTGVASELITLINDEWEAIEGYNNAIASLRCALDENPFYADAIKVLEEISAEENVHVGQLQEVLARISPNAKEIHKGTAEAKSQLGLVNGLLPVQSWDEYRKDNSVSQPVTTSEDEQCTLSDIDDDM